MTLPVVIPNEFANATASIPLSQLDSNFSTLANVVNEINAGTQQLSNANVVTLIVTGNATIGDASSDTVTLNSTLTANTAVIFSAGTSAAPAITTTGDTNTGIFFPAADTIAFAEGGAEAMRINSSGKVLVNTTTARSSFAQSSLTPQFQVEGLDAATSTISVTRNSNDSSVPRIYFGKSRGTTLNSVTAVQSGDFVGQFDFEGADGTQLVTAARISAVIDGTPGTNDMPGRLVFATTPDGSDTPTERMRITSDGYLRMASGTGGIQFNGDTAAANALDDYEEGTWTPTYFGASTAGTSTYTQQTGIYTKVGRLVTVTGRVGVSAATGTGQLRIGGLPFTCNSTLGAYTAPMVIDVNWGGGTYLILVAIVGETNCEVFYCADDAAIVNQSVTNESQNWAFTFSYNT